MTAWKITLLATQWLLLSAQTIPEPFWRPRELTEGYVAYLRSVNVMPPVEFDHEYKGELKVVRATQSELHAACPGTFKPGYQAIGCALVHPASCIIYVADDKFLQLINYDVEIALRHERAHCNGWKHPPR